MSFAVLFTPTCVENSGVDSFFQQLFYSEISEPKKSTIVAILNDYFILTNTNYHIAIRQIEKHKDDDSLSFVC